MGCSITGCGIMCAVDPATAAGLGGTFGGDCGGSVANVSTANIIATPNAGSSFTSWSCVATGTTFFSGGTANHNLDVSSLSAVTIDCKATFGLAPPPIAASVDSPLALSLVLLGIVAVAGFQRWRKRV